MRTMAAKKKKTTVAARGLRLARVRAKLPHLDDARRAAFRAAFSDADCLAWGRRLKAAQVVADAERFIGAVHAILQRGPVTGYGAHRLAWLAELTGQLFDAVRDDEASVAATLLRNDLLERARRRRRTLLNILFSVGHGHEALRAQLARLPEGRLTPRAVSEQLFVLVDLATGVQKSEAGRVLAEDAGLTEASLSEAVDDATALRAANEASVGEGTKADSAHTNALEGRVLREMAFAATIFRRAREAGEVVGYVPPNRSLARLRPTRKRRAAEPPSS